MQNRLPMNEFKEKDGYEPHLSLSENLSRIGKNWGWILAAGLAFIVIGIAAITWPIRSTAGLTLTIGALLTVSGLVHLFQAIQLRKESGTGWRVFHAVVALAAGFLMLRFPGAGMIGVAIALTFYFFISAAIKASISLAMRPNKGWGWLMASAVASFLLADYIILALPFASLWVPGMLLGLDLIIYGMSMIGFSMDLKKFHQRVRDDRDRFLEESKVA